MAGKTAEVVNLHDFRRTGGKTDSMPRWIDRTPTIEETMSTSVGSSSAVVSNLHPAPNPGGRLHTDLGDLYPDAGDDIYSAFASRTLSRNAQRLLSARNDGPIEMDDAVSHLKADLGELFLRQEMPDGTAAVIIALHHSLQNTQGQALLDAQYDLTIAILEILAATPSLRFSRAIELVDSLADAGFQTDPNEAQQLHEMFDGARSD